MLERRPDHPNVFRRIATIRAESFGAVCFAVSSPLPQEFPGPVLHAEPPVPYLRHFLLGTMGFTSVFLLAMLTSPTYSSEQIVALRNPPAYECTGRNCIPAASTEAVKKEQVKAAAPVEKKKGFSRFHAAPPDFHKVVLKRADTVQGVYLTASSVKRTQKLDDTITSLQAAGGDTIIFDAKGGVVWYNSEAPMAKELGLINENYNLKEITQKLREKGIYVMVRFVAVKDWGFTQARPDTLPKDPRNGRQLGSEWIDPENPVALEYNRQILCEIAAAGVDEINMDYIRFSTANFGELSVWNGAEKAAKVKKFVVMAREAIDSCGNGTTKLGVSTYAILGWNYPANLETLGQDVKDWASIVDIISPMAYPATFTSDGYYIQGKHPGPRPYWLVYRTLTGYADLVGPENYHKIRPWIQGYSFTAEDIKQEIRAIYEAGDSLKDPAGNPIAGGFCGFTVWNAGNNYDPTYKAMKMAPTKPQRCL